MAHTVWLTRHGNREDFVDPEWVETAARPHDPGLSPDGVGQADRLAERLETEGISHIFASPFLRTVHTAAVVAEVLDLPVYLEPGLGEWMNPDWFSGIPDTLGREELAARYPRIDLRYSPLAHPEFPETEGQALERAGRTARRLADAFSGSLLLVGHGVSVTGAVQGLVPDARVNECALCSLFRAVRGDDGWRLDLAGDVAHLDRRAAADRFN